MKKGKKIALTCWSIVWITLAANAQQGFTTSGGDATGKAGGVSYSIGQVDFISSQGPSGSVNQGIQQPKILIITGIEYTGINLSWKIYPNPTSDIIILEINEISDFEMRYVLSDARGIIVETKELKHTTTQINLGNHAAGFYFLTVLEQNKKLKEFKIIKNQSK